MLKKGDLVVLRKNMPQIKENRANPGVFIKKGEQFFVDKYVWDNMVLVTNTEMIRGNKGWKTIISDTDLELIQV